jgi:hypothetical protein
MEDFKENQLFAKQFSTSSHPMGMILVQISPRLIPAIFYKKNA